MRMRTLMIAVLAGLVVATMVLAIAPMGFHYYYARKVKQRPSEMQPQDMAEAQRQYDLYWRNVSNRDFLVRCGQIDRKEIGFTNVSAKVLYVGLKTNFPGLDYAMPARAGVVSCVVVYGSTNVTQAVEHFVKEHDVKPGGEKTP